MADTGSYFYAAYLVAGVLFVAYAVSLATRRRRVLRRLAQLEATQR